MNVFYYLIPVALAIATKALHHLLLDASGFRKKSWIIAGICALWGATVLWLAHCFCANARTAEECFLLWTTAFAVGCIFAVFQVFLLLLSRSKRQISGLDRMKLKDL